MTQRRLFQHGCLVGVALCALVHATAQSAAARAVTAWTTNQPRTQLLTRSSVPWDKASKEPGPGVTSITVDASRRYQVMDGFGFAMTGGSAQLLQHMAPEPRHALLEELFGHGPGQMGISYLRLSIGSSDMNDHVFTYDDRPAGETDPALQHFSLAEDEADVIPVMREILAISPRLQILATPWSAPSWMKTNGLPKGGELKAEFYATYANYLVRYLKGMRAHGITIHALTLQNEPLNPKNTPSMVMEANAEETFLRDAFGPALQEAGLHTKVVLFDHNCNHPDYPETILQDAKAAQYADGSGFHLYEGEISAMSQVHEAFPGKNLYFTEQMVVEHTQDGVLEPVARPVARIVIGAVRNWSKSVLLWNLAADKSFGPHTSDGGCPVCQGAITVDGDHVDRNIALYTVAQVSSFVPPGSVRIGSSEPEGDLANVAWHTPSGRYVLLLTNTGSVPHQYVVQVGAKQFSGELEAGSVTTFVW